MVGTIETYFLFITVLAADILIIMHILLHKNEEPVSAVLWIFMVISFPILGVLLYLLWGINRLETLGLKIKIANALIYPEQKKHTYKKFIYREYQNNEDYWDYNKTIDRLLPNTIPIKGNKLNLLSDGTNAFPQMLAAIKKAKHHIHLQSFIIHNDPIGKKILDTLAAKAKQGVKVKIIYDKFGSLKGVFSLFFTKYFKWKRKIKNFAITSFALANLFAPWRIQLRNHRKLLVVDGEIAFVGGINISSENDIKKANKDKYIHDLHCKLEGPAIHGLQFSFLRDWHYASGDPPEIVFQEQYFPPVTEKGNAVIRIIDSGPGQKYEATEKAFLAAAATAKKSLWIMTPYFIPNQAFIKALSMAAARGVKVKIIVPKNNNHWYAKFASRSLYPSMLSNNIEIYEKQGIFSHAKAMLVDNLWGYMGSSNCDMRSFRLNYELDFVIAQSDFMHDLYKQFLAEFDLSQSITLENVLKKSLPIKLLENICALLTPIL